MKRENRGELITILRAGVATVAVLAAPLFADQVELLSGDRYSGRILSFDTNSVVLQNDLVGTVTLPRRSVTTIHIGDTTPQARPLSNSVPMLNRSGVITNSLRSNRAALATSNGTNIMEQVRAQLLSDAGPEANNKFDQLAGGLLSGNLSVADIRAEAKAAVDQVRALKREMGDDATGSLDGYLIILDKFLAETASVGLTTNSMKSSPVTNQKVITPEE